MSAPLPEAPRSVAAFAAWSRGLEDWFGDALGLRSALLTVRSASLASIWRVSPTQACVLGRDHWVFLTQDRALECERGAAPMSAYEVERWAASLTARKRFCQAHGSDYLYVLVPDKPAVYADSMPGWDARIGPSRLEQLAARMHGDASFLDLRAALARARAADQELDHAFFPYGSHWTDRGAVAGVGDILARLRESERFAALRPFEAADFVWWPEGFDGDTWARRLYLSRWWSAPERSLGDVGTPRPVDVVAESTPPARLVTAIDDPSLPRILVFHDSFGIPLQKFVAHRASRSVCLWGQDFSSGIVQAEKPDLVLEVHVDRVLENPPLDDLSDLRAAAQARFEAARSPAWRLDPERDTREMLARGGADLELTPAGLRVQTHGSALLQVPSAALSKGAASLVLRVDIEAEAGGEIVFFYRTETEREYARRLAISTAVAVGTNHIFLDLCVPGIRGPLLFSTQIGGKPYTITAMESRDAP